MRTALALLGGLAPLLALACQSGHGTHDPELERIAARHERERLRFEEARADLARRSPVPQVLDFPEQGRIVVHECELVGYPGREELRLVYSYENTSAHSFDSVRVTLTLSDAQAGAQHSEVAELVLPLRARLSPDSSYTTRFQVPTQGLHLQPGWRWELHVEAHSQAESAR